MNTPVLESLKIDSVNIVKLLRTDIMTLSANSCFWTFPFYEDGFTECTWIKWTIFYSIYMGKKNLFRKGIKMKTFLLFTIIYPKINMNDVKTILPQQHFGDTH